MITPISTYYKRVNNFLYIEKGYFDVQWIRWSFLLPTHIMGLCGLYLVVTNQLYNLWFFHYVLSLWSGVGITGGAHRLRIRLWSHRAFEASLPCKLFLWIGFAISGQFGLYRWILEHRIHHKYQDTDADPYNSKRGFVFSHIGWVMQNHHPMFFEKAKTIDVEDIDKDKLVVFHEKFMMPIFALFAVIIPILLPVYLWDIPWKYAILHNMWRAIQITHTTSFVNSAAHMFGSKPYNEKITPVENLFVTFGAMGEGYHNYHHTFPNDYAASEDGFGLVLNPTKRFIDLMAFMGLAHNLKRPSQKAIEGAKKRVQHTLLHDEEPNLRSE